MRGSRVFLLSIAALLVAPASASWGDAGVLIPVSVSQTPDPTVLALRSMDVSVRIEGLHAEVHLDQVFQNLTSSPVEGKYVFPLGAGAVVKSFALWQGDDRFPSVVVEKQRGKEIYRSLVDQSLDPGLLETGDDAQDAGLFSLHVAPIPAYGTSRIELTYEEDIPLASFTARWTLPFQPRRYAKQTAGSFSLAIEAHEPWALATVKATPESWFRGQVAASPGQSFALAYKAKSVDLTDDIALEMTLTPPPRPISADLQSYRNVGSTVDRSALGGGTTYVEDHGFFVVRALFADAAGGAKPATPALPRDVVVLVDGSLSMQWDKLDRTMAALGDFLGTRLGSSDRFDVVVFNDDLHTWKDALQPASAATTADALAFVRASYLAGGTDLATAIEHAGALLASAPRPGATRSILLLSDGLPTSGDVDGAKIRARVAATLGAPGPARPRLFIYGVGDDADTILLRQLADDAHGALALVGDGDQSSFSSRTLFDELGGSAYDGLDLTLPPAANTDLVYADAGTAFTGSAVTFYGRYLVPDPTGSATLSAQTDGGGSASQTFPAPLVAADTTHPEIARGWAWRRVQDLLERIRADGEKDEWVSEIVSLARRYGFVTPYTSMLAASRSQLRPRNLQPGDPYLQIKAAPGTRDVVALFPFGLMKPLEYVAPDDLWETRFLAPTSMTDGTYHCTVILTDADGHKFSEDKSFVIDSRPPEVAVTLATSVVHPGDQVVITARADADTRTVRARIGDGPSVDLRWTADAEASRATLPIPVDLAPGVHQLVVVAEDFAHNTTIKTVPVTVVER